MTGPAERLKVGMRRPIKLKHFRFVITMVRQYNAPERAPL
jgi:hypothetical protein